MGKVKEKLNPDVRSGAGVKNVRRNQDFVVCSMLLRLFGVMAVTLTLGED